MEKELQDILNVIVNRLEKIDSRLEQVDKRFEQVDKRFDQVDKRFEQVDTRFVQMDSRFDRVESRLGSMESRQDEMYQMIRALEDNVKVTRAEQEKMSYILADVQGKVNMLTDEVQDHENVINQIRAIK